MRKPVRGIAATMVCVAVGACSAPARAQEPSICPTAPTYDSGVPTPESVFGFPLGLGQTQPVTSAQIDNYVQAVDAASDRVTSFEHLLANALLYPTGGAALRTLRRETVDGSSRAARPQIRRAEAQAPASDLGGDWRPIRLSVPEAQAATALAVVRRYAEPAAVERSGGEVVIVLANPEGLQADEHPFARSLLRALQAKGVRLRSAVL